MVLVGGDGHELGLCEGDGLKVLRLRHVLRLRVHVHHVETGLVLVHRVEDDLKQKKKAMMYLI